MPAWDSEDTVKKHGALARGALWLLQEVGVGGTFTKHELRDAFPGVAQIDRRIRELRGYGWTIRSSAEDLTLRPEQQMLVVAGAPVWEQGVRSKFKKASLTSKERSTALAQAAYMCRSCGISGGEPYPDKPSETAVLGAYLVESVPLVLCRWCRQGSEARESHSKDSAVDFIASRLSTLSDQDLKRLAFWMQEGRRLPTPSDRVWMIARNLGSEAKSEVEALLHREISNR